MPLLLQAGFVARAAGADTDGAAARDSFALAACFAAGADITPFLRAELKWRVSDRAMAALPGLLATPVESVHTDGAWIAAVRGARAQAAGGLQPLAPECVVA